MARWNKIQHELDHSGTLFFQNMTVHEKNIYCRSPKIGARWEIDARSTVGKEGIGNTT